MYLDKFVPFFLRLFYHSAGCPLAKELHESTFHDQPQTSRQVEDNSQEDEIDWDPLVVGVVDGALDVVLLGAGAGALVLYGYLEVCVHPTIGFQYFV